MVYKMRSKASPCIMGIYRVFIKCLLLNFQANSELWPEINSLMEMLSCLVSTALLTVCFSGLPSHLIRFVWLQWSSNGEQQKILKFALRLDHHFTLQGRSWGRTAWFPGCWRNGWAKGRILWLLCSRFSGFSRSWQASTSHFGRQLLNVLLGHSYLQGMADQCHLTGY